MLFTNCYLVESRWRQLILVVCLMLAVGMSKAQIKDSFVFPKLTDPASYTMILLPDLQNYAKFERNHPILDVMMNWIVANKTTLNIQMVFCTGDLVDDDDIVNPEFSKTDQTGTQQWKTLAAAFGKLDGQLPYITCTGNHDYNIVMASRSPKKTSFPLYFPAEKNRLTQILLREIAPNVDGIPSLENAFYEWRSPHGIPYLFLSLEFAPRDTLLTWASAVASQEKYKQHRVVLLTHSFLNAQNERILKEGYALQDVNYGQAIWEKLLQPSANFELVLSGHIAANNDARGHVAYRKDMNKGGRLVNQMTFNAQKMGGGGYGSGGDGWLRMLEFLPDGKTVLVKTFSPWFALSTTTQALAWRRESFDEFSFSFQGGSKK